MMKKVCVMALPLILFACSLPDMSKHETEVYNNSLEELKSLEAKLVEVPSYSVQEIESFLAKADSLTYSNDTAGMSVIGKESCMKLEKRIDIFKKDAESAASMRLQTISIPVFIDEDCLLEKTMAYPVYLERGDVLHYNIGLQKPGTVKLYNADAKALLKTYSQKTSVSDSLLVTNKGIYLVEVLPGGTQYASMSISYRMADHYHPAKQVWSEEISCSSTGFRVVSNRGVSMRPAFDQPRKFTLSSQLKSAFTTAAKSVALVPVHIPAGATDILYNLRISTSEQDKSSDGKFPDKMNMSYKKVRFLGLPLYDSSRGSGLFSTLLDDNRPLRDEDAYCNMYVFRSQWAAKQFQDGNKPASELQYDVDYSTLGTQSCNGRIPANGSKTIYLAFENERVRYTNYIWVEVLTVVPMTEYHTTKYLVD